MPGYEPFLLCDFHVHTRWSDGRLSVREVVDLYGQTASRRHRHHRHILMRRICWPAPAAGNPRRRNFGVREEDFDDYLADCARRPRARLLKRDVVVPGAEVTQNGSAAQEFAHHRARHKVVHQRRSEADAILREIRRQDGLSMPAIPIIARRGGSRSVPVTCGTTARSSPTRRCLGSGES